MLLKTLIALTGKTDKDHIKALAKTLFFFSDEDHTKPHQTETLIAIYLNNRHQT